MNPNQTDYVQLGLGHLGSAIEYLRRGVSQNRENERLQAKLIQAVRTLETHLKGIKQERDNG